MAEPAEIISVIEKRDPIGSAQLLPFVYDQLRWLARQRLRGESSGVSFDSGDLVHEAYLRLNPQARQWDNPGHFFAAAADEMRRILIDHKRRKRRTKHGGDRVRVELPELGHSRPFELEEVLALQEALDALEQKSAAKAELVKLRYFAGLTLAEVAALLEISLATANRHWSFSRAWLFKRLRGRSPILPDEPESPPVD